MVTVSVPLGHNPGVPPAAGRGVRVMVVDDSVTTRAAFSRMISKEPGMILAAQARSAEEALDQLETVPVDVILLDLDMPGIGGLNALPQLIRKSRGGRILVVSALTQDGAEHTVQALALGAAETLPKPQNGQFDHEYRELLLSRIRALGKISSIASAISSRAPVVPVLRRPSRVRPLALAVGASTGGIHALGQFFSHLPATIGVPILVTQHLPGSFMEALARQLQNASGREALIAEDGSDLLPDRILIAPGHAHMTVTGKPGRLKVRLDRQPVSSGCMPSVDPMFASLAQVLGPQALGLVLSGMGRDGTEGAQRVVMSGGTIMAQNEATCAVWGMPGSVAQAGLASFVQPPESLARLVAKSIRGD